MIRLSVNIDHVATLRNARGGIHPDPVLLAREVLEGGGNGITVHLREDRRHICDDDVIRLRHENTLPLTLEIAATEEMYALAQSIDPQIVCFVPERRQELTTEGGIALQNGSSVLQEFTKGLLKKNIDVSFFINPDSDDVYKAHTIGASIVELHTGYYCKAYERGDLKACTHELNRLQKAAQEAKTLGLKVHAGHGLTCRSVTSVAAILQIEALNIGHAIISDSLTLGLSKAVMEMRFAMCRGRQNSSLQSG
jgi:pyridoxine 5-phosphate synthase